MMTGQLDSEWWDWRDLGVFRWDAGADEAAPPEQHPQHSHHGEAQEGPVAPPVPRGLHLQCPFLLRSCCELRPPWTNFVGGYTGLLDYILYQPGRMRVLGAVPLPPREVVAAETALPSSRWAAGSHALSPALPNTLPMTPGA